MKKTITSLMASTMILGQLGGLTALAEEQESIHIENPEEYTDDEVAEAESLSEEEKLSDFSEVVENSPEDETDNETDLITFEDNPSENEEDINSLDAYEPDDYAPNYWDDYDDPYYDYYGNLFEHIDSLEVNVSSTEIAYGESIVISIPAEDLSTDTMGTVVLGSNTGNTHGVYLDYDRAANEYKGIFNFFNSRFDPKMDTVITVKYVELTDYISYRSETFYADKDQLDTFPTIYNNIEVPESDPIINLDSIKVSSNEIFDNEQIQVEVEIDSESDINSVEVYFKVNDYSGRTVELRRFKDTNLYVGFFRKFYSDESLDYNFSSVFARDIFGNETRLSAEDYDFSHLTIHYNHEEKPAAKEASYVPDSFSVSHSAAISGDVVEYKLKLENSEGMNEVTLSLLNESTRNSNNIKLYYDYETSYYRGEWHITDYDESGNYLPAQLYNHTDNNYFNYSFDLDYRNEHFVEVETATPQFKVNSIAFENSEVEAGTINRLLLDIDTNEPVDRYLLGLSGFHVNVAAYYNAETGLYEAMVHTSGLYRNDIIVENLFASIEERRLFIDLQDTDFNEVNFSIIPVEEDEERDSFRTTVDREAIKQPDSFVKAGETVRVTVPVADFSKIASGSVLYQTPLSYNSIQVDLVYNEEKMVFEALIPTDEASENGWWQARQIALMDIEYNNYYIGTWNDVDLELMNGLDFILSGGVNSGYVEPLTVMSIEKNADSFESGEDVQIAVGVTDSRFESLHLTYRMPESRVTRLVTADFNDETGVYEANLTLSDYTEAGRWVLEQVKASDNDIVDSVPVLSGGNFSVVNENSKVSLPKINTEEYSTSYNSETGMLKIRTSVTEPDLVSFLTAEYHDKSTGQSIYIRLTQTNDTGVFEGVYSLQKDTNLDNLRLMKIDVVGHEYTNLETVRTAYLNPVTGIEAAFSEIVIVSEESNDNDVSPEIPENDSDDDLDQDESESDEDADTDEEDEDYSSEEDTENEFDEFDESDEDNEEETDSEERDGSDVPLDETDDEANEDDSDSDSDEDAESDSEEIVEENNDQESDDIVEEETDDSASEDTTDDSDLENNLEPVDTSEAANDNLDSPSSDDENETEEEASTEENDSETVDSETTEVEEADESNAEEDTEDVDSSTVLPDTATVTWTIGMASLVSLMSGLGLRFASKKKCK